MFKVGFLGNESVAQPVGNDAVAKIATIAELLQFIFKVLNTVARHLSYVVLVALRFELPICSECSEQLSDDREGTHLLLQLDADAVKERTDFGEERIILARGGQSGDNRGCQINGTQGL